MGYKSCPEYEQLKDLLHSGKSATMLPSIAASRSGHWKPGGIAHVAACDPAAGRDAQPYQDVAAERFHHRHAFARRLGPESGPVPALRRARKASPSRAGCSLRPRECVPTRAHSRRPPGRPERRTRPSGRADREGRGARRSRVPRRGRRDRRRPSGRPAPAPQFQSCRCDPAARGCRRRAGRSRQSAAAHRRARRVAPGPSARDVPGDAARHDAIHHQAMGEGSIGRGEQALAEDAAMRVDQRERGVVADRADIAEMIGDALELRHHAAQQPGARRRLDLERGLDRAREGEAQRNSRVARDARHDLLGAASSASTRTGKMAGTS